MADAGSSGREIVRATCHFDFRKVKGAGVILFLDKQRAVFQVLLQSRVTVCRQRDDRSPLSRHWWIWNTACVWRCTNFELGKGAKVASAR